MNLKVTAAQMLLWAKTTFGMVAMDKRERALRLIEEVSELAQAADLTEADWVATGKRTWSREKDTVHKELGGVFVTLLAFTHVWSEDLEEALLDEVKRILAKPTEHWRSKHDAKQAHGIITGPVDQSLCQCDPPTRWAGSSLCQKCERVIGLRRG